MLENYDYSESFFHNALPYITEWSFYTMVGRFIYLRLKETIDRKKTSSKKLSEVRNKIAYEMHQDIGNDLNALVYKIKNWHAKNGNKPNDEFIQLEKSTIQVIAKVNDIVWSLNSEKNNLIALQNHLVNYAEETFTLANLTCSLNTANNLPKNSIELEIRKNIYLLFKEAINNVIKHANASHVEIQIKYQFRKLQISIIDNGKGFDSNSVIKGNGLDNMQNRIKKLNGKIEFKQNQPKGTIIKFEMKV